MSLDYPNRKDWLAARAPRHGTVRYIHRYNGFPYNVGRNEAKRAKRLASRRLSP